MTAKPILLIRLWRRFAQFAAAVALLAWPCVASSQETITYYTTDAVGSVRMVTDSGGAVVARYDYRPFGDPCGSACGPQGTTEKLQFAGLEKDGETGLHYAAARHYSNGMGRFTTVDPDHVGGDPLDPQSWNAYAYARNNPLRFVDPTGLSCEPSGYEADFRVCIRPPSSRPITDFLYGMLSGFLDGFTLTVVTQGPVIGEQNLPLPDPTLPQQLGGMVSPSRGVVRGVSKGVLRVAVRSSGPLFKTTKEAATAAAALGFRKINERSSGQAVFTDGKRFISRDLGGHNGGAWKVADSVAALGSRATRAGTFSADLLTRVGD